MQVSVVIPIYNAEAYLAESVASVLIQPEVVELILVDDGSKDGSLALAKELALGDTRIKVLTHPDGINRGSAETRNLGIKACTAEFVAFIDADDTFCENRFSSTKAIFNQHPDADGVYEAVVNFYTDMAQSRSATVTFDSVPDIHMVHQIVTPKELLALLVDDPVGIILLQGLCVKKSLFDKTGLFDPAFRVAEDMLLVKKMAAVGSLYPGDLHNPVSKRRIHDTNLSFSEYKDTNPLKFKEGETLLRWAMDKPIDSQRMNAILRFHYRQFLYLHQLPFNSSKARVQWVQSLVVVSPMLLQYREAWKALPLVGRFFN